MFIIGINQSRKYPADLICHQRHLDALFNRNGETCRGVYDEVTGGESSRTRRNIDRLAGRLNQEGIRGILETDVICYSTPTSKDLRREVHAGGAKRGREIFRYLLEQVRPPVLIVYGARAGRELSKVLIIGQLQVPQSADEVCGVQVDRHLVIPIPSLSPPAFNGWSAWSGELMDLVATRVRDRLACLQ